MKKLIRILLIMLAVTCGLSYLAHADDDPFGYLYTTDSLPKGGWEFEHWMTSRDGKARGTYNAVDFNDEIEYGVTDRFTASVYFNSFYLNTNNTYDPDDVTSNLRNQNTFDYLGNSFEFRYRVLSPYTDGFGLSLYAEPEFQYRDPLTGEYDTQKSIETRIIMQKNFLDDQLVIAANLEFEPEWERDVVGNSGNELEFESTLGASYKFMPNWAVGLELRNIREYSNMNWGQEAHLATYVGPNIHYAGQNFWATFTVLPQIAGTPTDLGVDSTGATVSDGFRNLGEYEKLQVRLKIGIEI